jgi:hypothetical protein
MWSATESTASPMQWPRESIARSCRSNGDFGGYRNRENFKTAIYFYCGGLDLHPQ